MKPRVTFILPTRNRPLFVKTTLEAAAEYVGKNDEFIIVDASRDQQTKKIVDSFPFVTKYLHVDDRGEAYSVNSGLLEAKGEIVKEVSDDDIIFPKEFKAAISYLEENPEVEAIQCGGEACQLNEDGSITLIRYEKLPKKRFIAQDFNALVEYVPCGVGLIFRRSILPKVGLFDSSFTAVDTNFMARIILAKCNFKYLDICLYRHILFPHSAENRDEQIHADRSRSYALLSMWDESLTLKTVHVAKSLGIGTTDSDKGYLWVIKLLNYSRHTWAGKGCFWILGGLIELGRNVFLSRISTPVEAPYVAKWSGKSW